MLFFVCAGKQGGLTVNVRQLLRSLSRFERTLWICSLIVVTVSFLLTPTPSYLSLAASLIGVTALIFIAKGYVVGQVLIVIFAVFYGVISFLFRYYGEMITYLCMSAPMAIASIVAWSRHPYADTAEVSVSRATKKQLCLALLLTAAVTVAFYFILRALHTANLTFSTISVATSFLASSLTLLRDPHYAAAYAANDIVLIVLWILAAVTDIGYLPMIFCFLMFLFNDSYAFFNWKRIKKRQTEDALPTQ
ncbi:MAG: nicotinamide mononucleotide transporter [Oscillospiraceae bacterium]|nr:nicotinamide mononucleotide transporter [Oscillospiraceae bacterium]